MNFVYEIMKANTHEPSLNVMYTPEDGSLTKRFEKVYYEPTKLEGLDAEGVHEYFKKLCIHKAPLHKWEREVAVESVADQVAVVVNATGTVTAADIEALKPVPVTTTVVEV